MFPIFTLPEFFLFLALILPAYWLARRNRICALAVVLLADYFFYAKFHLIYLWLIPLAASCDFAIGRALGRWKSRWLVGLSIAINCGLIIVSRYVPFLFHGGGWIFPLGLSFYAFQAMTYTLDIYRGNAKPAASLLAVLASVSYFPTILAGPITRMSKLAPQLENVKLRLTAEEGGRALFLIGLGVAKKLLIADYLAGNLVNRVFDTPKLYSGLEVLLASYGYAFQLYYDFSGYTDIAIGAALLMGIRLPVNFNRPYSAVNVADFWRRWHISFSSWLRDYLYFSLPGQRSRWRPYLNLVITMTVGGLWHGANWTFAVWGLLHGVGLAVVRLVQSRNRPVAAGWRKVVSIAVTFHFVIFAWIFFRAPSMAGAMEMFRQIASGTASVGSITMGFGLVLGIAIIIQYFPGKWYSTALNAFVRTPAPVQAAILALLLIGIRLVAATGSAPFIYSRF
jgi:D-alanyl-lipoteichoic acid acyltransferase DltB (MBOAT superfamily)